MAARFGFAFALTALFASAASAQTVHFFDDFESYANQTEFEAAWETMGLAAATSSGGTNYLVDANFPRPRFNPPEGEPDIDLLPGSTQMVANYNLGTRNGRSIGETGIPSATNVISLSFDFYDVDASVAPFRHWVEFRDTAAPTSFNGLVAIGMNNNQNATTNGGNRYMARIVGYNPADDAEGAESGGAAGSFFKLNDFGDAGLRSTGWHNFRVDITSDDDLSTDYYFYVDGQLAEQVLNVGTAASLRSYDYIVNGSGLTSGKYLAYTDNLSVVLNPPPILPPGGNADFNGDGFVDGNDFLKWQRDGGSAADLQLWKEQFGTNPGAAAAVAAVPEPATAGLAAVAMLASLALVRRRQA